jgi:hypothetical protein
MDVAPLSSLRHSNSVTFSTVLNNSCDPQLHTSHASLGCSRVVHPSDALDNLNNLEQLCLKNNSQRAGAVACIHHPGVAFQHRLLHGLDPVVADAVRVLPRALADLDPCSVDLRKG